MKVYHDFFTYQGGIYKHSDISAVDRTGYHSVRIVGWGEEQDYYGRVRKYWVSNTIKLYQYPPGLILTLISESRQ